MLNKYSYFMIKKKKWAIGRELRAFQPKVYTIMLQVEVLQTYTLKMRISNSISREFIILVIYQQN